MALLYQIYYADYQKEYIFPCATPYFNDKLTIFFENEPISRLVMETTADKIGVCSWKLKEKLRWYVGRPRPITQEVLETDYDVLSFTRNTDQHRMLDTAEIWHKGFKDALKKICDGIGVRMPFDVKKPIYQNHFMAKTEIYKDYVKTYLIPAMELIKNDIEINKTVMIDSNYSALAKKDAASPEILQQKIGFPYYPLAPFLLERLFSVYVQNKNINVTWL